ncbi:MAG: sulfatase-like hydrolase/transferase, partial [Verrucomicrobiae bacterium]|nr:sulfatase-like hydrolase/transferase [Verrucomicrobiae bacterium]
KWHLGDNYPSRPQDQGFEETFYHKSGGIGQPPDEDGTYWKPVIYHNGEREVHDRYCTDLFFDKAIEFMNLKDSRPYFLYLPTNVPHTPLDVDERYYRPFMEKGVAEKTARIYGMLKNLDENIARLLTTLDQTGEANNTVVIFLSDNGGIPQTGFQGDFRGHKGDIYEGGIRSPFFVRWPDRIKRSGKEPIIAAHFDILPTLAAIGGAELPQGRQLDGTSLLDLWTKDSKRGLEDRTLVIQFVKSIEQAMYKCAAVISQGFKLVLNPESAFDSSYVANRKKNEVALYDIASDAGEEKDLAAKHPNVIDKLLQRYESWYASVKASRDMQPGRIFIDPSKEDPVHLSRYQEGYHWHHDSNPEGWMLDVKKAGLYRLHFTDSKNYPFSLELFWQRNSAATAVIMWDEDMRRIPLKPGNAYVDVPLYEGPGRLDMFFEMQRDGKKKKDWNCDITIEYLGDLSP